MVRPKISNLYPWLVKASVLVSIAVLAPAAFSQSAGDPLDIVYLRSNFFVIAGAGGNIAAQVGPDGVVIVDAGTREAADRVISSLKKVTDQPIRYIIDTGPDTDHVAGNGILAKTGRSIFAAGTEPLGGDFAKAMTDGFAASIIAPNRLLARMSAPTGQKAPFPSDSWPTESFAEKRKYSPLTSSRFKACRPPRSGLI